MILYDSHNIGLQIITNKNGWSGQTYAIVDNLHEDMVSKCKSGKKTGKSVVKKKSNSQKVLKLVKKCFLIGIAWAYYFGYILLCLKIRKSAKKRVNRHKLEKLL